MKTNSRSSRHCVPYLVVLTIVLLCGLCDGKFQAKEDAEEVDVSPKCAAVLISGGALGGAGVAYAVTPAALCTAGFCPAGVSAASFASWWQSTMPLVQASGLVATLQSAAMGGVGVKVMTGGMLGGAMGGRYLRELCAYVDDPDSELAPVFDAILAAVRGVNKVAETAKSWWKALSDKTEIWSLEKEAKRLREDIKELKENTYSGRIADSARGHVWSHGWLNWLSEGTIEKIFALEKKLEDCEARLFELKHGNS